VNKKANLSLLELIPSSEYDVLVNKLEKDLAEVSDLQNESKQIVDQIVTKNREQMNNLKDLFLDKAIEITSIFTSIEPKVIYTAAEFIKQLEKKHQEISAKVKNKTNEAKIILEKTFDENEIKKASSELQVLTSYLGEINCMLSSNANSEIISLKDIEAEMEFFEEIKSRIYTEITMHTMERKLPSEENELLLTLDKTFKQKFDSSGITIKRLNPVN